MTKEAGRRKIFLKTIFKILPNGAGRRKKNIQKWNKQKKHATWVQLSDGDLGGVFLGAYSAAYNEHPFSKVAKRADSHLHPQ